MGIQTPPTSKNSAAPDSKSRDITPSLPANLFKVAYSQGSTLAAAALLLAVMFVFGLGSLPFVGPDEPRYAQVGREMSAGGDFITPRLCGHILFEKPVLLYWGEAAAYRVLGVSEFTARLPSALAAAVCAVTLFLIIRWTVSSRLAVIVSTVLATSGLFVAYARVAITDMLLTSSICVALSFFYLLATREGRGRSLFLAGCCAATGMAVLAKGLVGAVIVAAIVVVSYLLTGKPRGVRLRDVAVGMGAFIAVAGAWYLPVALEHGQAFIDEFFINQHFKRYLSNRYSHPQPIWFFPVIVAAGALPWTFFFLPALRTLRRLNFRKPEGSDYLRALAWIWLLVPLVFFSFSKSKLPGYIVPTMPAVAIILGFEVERLWRQPRDTLLSIAAWLTTGLLLAMAVALPVYLSRQGFTLSPVQFAICCVPLVIALAGVGVQLRRGTQTVIIIVALVVSGIVIATTRILLPQLDDRLTHKRLAVTAAESLRPGEMIAIYMDKKYNAVFYAEGRVVYREEMGDGLNSFNLDEIADSVQRFGSVIVITTVAHRRDLEQRFVCAPITEQGRHIAVRVSMASDKG